MCRDRGWRAGLCHRRLACVTRRRGVKSGWRVVAQAGLHCTRRSLCCVTAPRGDTATLAERFIFFNGSPKLFCQKQAHSHKRQSTNPIIRVRSFRSFTAGACRAHSGQRSLPSTTCYQRSLHPLQPPSANTGRPSSGQTLERRVSHSSTHPAWKMWLPACPKASKA